MAYPLSMPTGRVQSLHLHPAKPGTPLTAVDSFEVVAEKGIREDGRYFARTNENTGEPNPRQVSLIERDQLAEHAQAFGLPEIPPGAARANIETDGIYLTDHVGQRVRVGAAILQFYEPRKPCHKMDAIAPGLQERMKNGQQGVMAQVVESGVIRLGDEVEPLL